MNKKAQIEKFMKATRAYINAIDTTEEVRYQTNYRFMVWLIDQMEENGVPVRIASLAATRILINLPQNLENEHPNEFNELIRLWAKTLSVTYKTLDEDFDASLVPEMFYQMTAKTVIEFEF